MTRTLKILLLVSVLATNTAAAPAVRQTPAAGAGDQRKAVETLALAVAGEKKKDPDAWFRLGIEYNRAGEVRKAREAFQQALKLRRKFPAARAGLAYTFFVEKNFAEAEREAYRAVVQSPDRATDSTARNVLGRVWAQRYREAAIIVLARAEQALAKNPGAPDGNRHKAEALIALSIPEQEIPPDLSFPAPPPPPDEAAWRAAREETRVRDREAAACLEKYLSLAPRAPDADYVRRQLEVLRFYSQDPESLPAADRPYPTAKVSTKALITYKPEPGFTEEARKADLVGMVRLRAVLAADGKIKHLLVIMPLPYGMTENAIKAASQIKFKPATIDGAPVSQHVILEYNFNVF